MAVSLQCCIINLLIVHCYYWCWDQPNLYFIFVMFFCWFLFFLQLTFHDFCQPVLYSVYNGMLQWTVVCDRVTPARSGTLASGALSFSMLGSRLVDFQLATNSSKFRPLSSWLYTNPSIPFPPSHDCMTPTVKCTKINRMVTFAVGPFAQRRC